MAGREGEGKVAKSLPPIGDDALPTLTFFLRLSLRGEGCETEGGASFAHVPLASPDEDVDALGEAAGRRRPEGARRAPAGGG